MGCLGPPRVLLAFLVTSALAGCERDRADTGSTLPDKGAPPTARHTGAPLGPPRFVEPGPDWVKGTLSYADAPVDLRFLNAEDLPAGQHGHVQAQGDQLVFEDGTSARFWGTNLTAYALFHTDKATARAQARRLAAFGFNLVRLTHHDSDWVVPNVFAQEATTSQELNPKALDRLDYLIKALKDEGIYLWVDLHVGRKFALGDQIEGYDEIARDDARAKGFSFVNPRIEALMQRFARTYVTRKNPYTGLSLAEDPAVIAFLLTNENDLVSHFGNRMLADSGYPTHHRLFKASLQQHADRLGVPLQRAMETWQPGPAKLVLSEMEHGSYSRAITQLRGLGVKAPIAVNNYWGQSPFHALKALATGDVIDVHAYGSVGNLRTDPRRDANYLAYIAGGRVAGMPMTITEWNVPYPARDRFTAPLQMAAVSALQGWQAPMLYAYQTGAFEPQTKPFEWSVSFDPAVMATMPNAALLFRRGDVMPAREHYRVELDADTLFGSNAAPQSSRAVRTLVERSRVSIGLPAVDPLRWDRKHRDQGVAVSDLQRDFQPPSTSVVQSDTGQLRRDFQRGVYTVDTARTQAAAGWIGGAPIRLGDTEFALDTPAAAVAVSSLDGAPLARSKRILVSLTAQASAGGDPYVVEPVRGQLALRNPNALRVIPLSPTGQELPELPSERTGDRMRFTLPGASHWVLLRGVPASQAPAGDPT